MTPKEKAIELLDDFIQINGNSFFAKDCVRRCVDEIIKAIDFDWMGIQNSYPEYRYWQQVKQEIEKL